MRAVNEWRITAHGPERTDWRIDTTGQKCFGTQL